jgi:hypothetical protein
VRKIYNLVRMFMHWTDLVESYLFKLNCETIISCNLYYSLLIVLSGTNQYLCHIKQHGLAPTKAWIRDPWVERHTLNTRSAIKRIKTTEKNGENYSAKAPIRMICSDLVPECVSYFKSMYLILIKFDRWKKDLLNSNDFVI